MNLHLKRNHCRLCCSEKLDMVVALKPVPVGEHYFDSQEALRDKRFPIDIYQCELCKAVQTLDDIEFDTIYIISLTTANVITLV